MKQIYMFFLLLCGLSACSTASRKAEKEIIMVSIEPLRYFAEQIAGKHFSIVSMVPKGVSPETYDPTPQQMVQTAQAVAFLRIGDTPFERMWADKIKQNMPDLPFFNLSDGVELIKNADLPQHHHHHGKEEACRHGEVDPHIWLSIHQAEKIAQNIATALIAIDGKNEADYRANLQTLLDSIRQTKQQVDAYMQKADNSFLIYHPALTYFAQEYGLEQLSLEEDGKQPSPDRLRNLVDICGHMGTRILFLQTEIDERNARVLEQELGFQVVPIDLLSYQWHETMLTVARTLSHTTQTAE